MENSNKFKQLIREQLIPFFELQGYRKTFDNLELETSEMEKWVFRLVFEGHNKIEISNEDWRDYTEYFNLYVNSRQIHSMNVNNYSDLTMAYESLIGVLAKYLS